MPQGTASRAQAFHDKSGHTYTPGGLNCHDLVLDKSDGLIKSKKKVRQGVNPEMAARAKAQAMVVGTQKGVFKQFPKKGTVAYKKIQKLAKKMM